MPPQSKLLRRFLWAATPTCLAVFFLYVMASISIDWMSDRNRLNDKISKLCAVYSLLYAEPLANLDQEKLKVFSISLISDEEIAFIQVLGANGEVVEHFGHPGAQSCREPIVYADENGPVTVGELTLGGSHQLATERLRDSIRNWAILLILLVAALLLSLRQVFRTAVLGPIARLTRTMNDSRLGQLHQDLPLDQDSELVELIASYNRMQRERDAATRELLQHQQELESVIAHRTAGLQQSNKELEEFAYAVSHDLQAPLRSISGFANLIRRRHGAELPDSARDLLAEVIGGSERMNEMIEGLLQLSRIGRQGEIALVDLAAVAREVLADLAADLQRRNVQVELGPLPELMGRRAELRQLLQQLIENAYRFHTGDASCRIELFGQRNPEGFQFTVRDNGPGIAEQDRPRLFRMFSRLHDGEEHSGLGIGLAICHRIVRTHGGRIWIETGPSGGSDFIVALPRNPQQGLDQESARQRA